MMPFFSARIPARHDHIARKLPLKFDGVFIGIRPIVALGVTRGSAEIVPRRRPQFVQLRNQIAITVASESRRLSAAALRQPLTSVAGVAHGVDTADDLDTDRDDITIGGELQRGPAIAGQIVDRSGLSG